MLNIKEVSYSLNLKEESLIKKAEDLFEQKTLSFVGEFTNENEFRTYDKWNVVGWDMPNLKRKSAYLKGKIIKLEKGIRINISIKPNSIVSVFAIVSILMGVFFSILVEPNKENNHYLIVGVILIFMGIICCLSNLFLRNRLQKNFEECLGLK